MSGRGQCGRVRTPSIHINHGRNFTSHFNIYSKEEVWPSDPYWGDAADWWE